MNRKGKNILILAVVVALTVCIGLLAVNGAQIGKWRLKPVGEAISLGLDLRGGVYAVYKAKDPNQEDLDTLIDGTISIMRTRLSDKGYNEATVTKQGDDRIRIEIPDVQDPAEVLNIIGTPARLEFRTSDGTVVITGDDVKSATAVTDAAGSEYKVRLVLNDSGKEAFAKATSENIGKAISIYLDDNEISSPTVNSAITGGEALIEGSNFTLEYARELSSLIQSGALPLDIEQDEVSAVSATLGVDVIERAVTAGIIGVILVMLFMIAVYRVSGVVASLALSIYIIIVFYLMALVPGIQLTLPGIAGIVLAIGMAVDANVIIFERVREELKTGRGIDSAIKRGFKNALSAIIDSNVTTIIASFVLMYFGTGSIRGFANTLFIGVVVSMFTAIVVTRLLLKCMAGIGLTNPKLYSR
ncbi:MAG: protein translocase subunit SecD [Candidatus Fimadaptatus sp.]